MRRIVQLLVVLVVVGVVVGIIASVAPSLMAKFGGDGDAVATVAEPAAPPEPSLAVPEPPPVLEPEAGEPVEPEPETEPEAEVEDAVPENPVEPDENSDDSDRPAPQIVVIPPIDGHGNQSESDFEKKQLAAMIGSHSFEADELFTFKIKDKEGHELFVRTTLDPDIQAWAVSFLPKQKVRAAALVVMDPETGEVLAMAGHNEKGSKENVALSSSFPAASLFKIVTAAAVVEKEKMDSESKLAYDGGRHTLYKRDVTKGIKKGSHQVTLKEGFAHSINTVFGKLGAFTLGPKELEAFANKFHFNQPIGFELPVQQSRFETDDPDDPYRLAELASGFNRTTQVSPLHGAMLASAIVNSGRLMEPTVVREVFDLNNRIYYRHETVGLGQVVSTRTVGELKDLMRATVKEGTGRRRFWDAKKHPVLSKLDIGGKSGTINNNQGHKVDWFVGYAGPKKSKHAIALAAVVVHGPKLGVRSQELVREAIIRYYGPKLTKKKK